jgi:hypothetical protein
MTGQIDRGAVIPSMVDGGQWASCFGLSWADMLLADQVGSARIFRPGGQYLRNVAGTMGVAAARNAIVANFLALQHRPEWLFMVDTDMGFRPDTVDRLVASAEANGAQVIGALAFAQKSLQLTETDLYARRLKLVPTLYRYVEAGEEKGFLAMEDYLPDRFQWVDGTGAACLLMHRNALERVGPDPFRPIIVPDALPNGQAREFSEDLSFCARLANVEISVAVDTSIKTTHAKGGIFLDEETYRVQRLIRNAGPLGLATGGTVGYTPPLASEMGMRATEEQAS